MFGRASRSITHQFSKVNSPHFANSLSLPPLAVFVAKAVSPRPIRPYYTTSCLVKMAPTSTSTEAGPKDRRPIVLSGPSGVGKGTLFGRLVAAHPGQFALSVSHTTRAPRPGERDGVHYHFVKAAEFDELVRNGGFVEHAVYGSNKYGTSKRAIEELSAAEKVVVLDIEMEGLKQIKQSPLQARYVFIKPPSLETLEQRLRGRGTESEESIQKRLGQARKELEFAETPGVHDKVIVNENLDTAFKELEAWIYASTGQ